MEVLIRLTATVGVLARDSNGRIVMSGWRYLLACARASEDKCWPAWKVFAMVMQWIN